jgi:hypothetical protein
LEDEVEDLQKIMLFVIFGKKGSVTEIHVGFCTQIPQPRIFTIEILSSLKLQRTN